MADYLSYNDLKKIAKMSLSEFKESKYYKKGFIIIPANYSKDEIKDLIERAGEAVSKKKEYAGSWSEAVDEAKDAYDSMYKESLNYLQVTANVSKEQKDAAYNASVSDNYANHTVSFTDSNGRQMAFNNITVDTSSDDGVDIDWSELRVLKKTRLSGGSFEDSEVDDFGSNAEIGESRNVCGGTITYLGKKSVKYDRGGTYEWYEWLSHNAASWCTKIPILGDLFLGDSRVNMVHYEGVLGSFDYDANEFSLGYWTYTDPTTENEVKVPCLHYMNDGAVKNKLNMTYNGFLDGEKIKIPEGVKCADYMFAGTGIFSTPKLPKGLESAHCMFMNCENLCYASESATAKGGGLKMPSSLKDISWMFSGCPNMQDYFKSFNESLLDGRYAFAGCTNLGWDGESTKVNEETGETEMVTSFSMPDVSQVSYADPFWLSDMFDGVGGEVGRIVTKYFEKNGKMASEWTDEETGVHYNRYDKLVNSKYDSRLDHDIAAETDRAKILQLLDPESSGLTGAASDTNGLAEYHTQITDEGIYSDNSTWAKFRQSDFEKTFGQENKFGELLDRAIPAVGTYAVSKAVLDHATGGDHKLISTAGAVALAAVPQVVGFGNRLTPILDWVANTVGTDTKVGNFFKDLSDKLKGSVTYHTHVEELNADETFEEMQTSAVRYAGNQVNRMMLQAEAVKGEGDVLIATKFDITKDMESNGKLLAEDANLLFIACEPEENLKATLSDSIMESSIEALRDKMDLDLQAAGGDKEKIADIRREYSSYYMVLLSNLDAYDNAAKQGISSKYAVDAGLKDQAMNGLEKVMRNAAEPVYKAMHELDEQWEKDYGEPFFSDKQMNEAGWSLSTIDITGIGSFKDYDPSKDYSSGSDYYVEQLAIHQQALVEAIQGASSQDEINAAYAAYYETAYGWALDEAEAHGVILDKRGALTTSEKNSFAEYVKRVEAEQEGNLEKDDARSGSQLPEAQQEQEETAEAAKAAEQPSGQAKAGSGQARHREATVEEDFGIRLDASAKRDDMLAMA